MSLQITDLKIGYREGKTVQHLDLSPINKGELIAVVGPNAVGKSTLMKSLAGLLSFQGKVTLDGVDLMALSSQQRMRSIGYLPQTLPQSSTLVPYEMVSSALRVVGTLRNQSKENELIDNVFNQLGINKLAFKPMTTLSGGQRQMIGLAQVLVREPQLLLLDEPTSALDLHWQLSVLEAVRSETLANDAIALLASHDLNLALRYCDRVLILARSGPLGMGPANQVLTVERLRQAYGIDGRIEHCSRGYPIVIADSTWSET